MPTDNTIESLLLANEKYLLEIREKVSSYRNCLISWSF